ncbi:hypothetical protein [Rhizobium sp. LjRoot254]|uniref:hypothetical protein n=1 Tax=Rhizobium sp. LjRoot254 TaxID=3342297 RepID=UPI003ED16D23
MKKTLFVAATIALSAAFIPAAHADSSATTTGVVAGAATGAVVAGPVGAVVGGAVGLTTGAIIDDAGRPRQETVIIKKRQPNVVIQQEPSTVIVDE